MIRARLHITGPVVLYLELPDSGTREGATADQPTDEPGDESGGEPAHESGCEPSEESVDESGKEPAGESGDEPGQPAGQPSTTESAAAFTPELLRERRIAAGLSMDELSRRTGVAQKTIGNIERGRHIATATTLHRLCTVAELNLTPKPTTLGARPTKGSEP